MRRASGPLLVSFAVMAGAGFAAPGAAAQTTLCTYLGRERICTTPIAHGQTRVCITTYLEGVSVERCTVRSAPRVRKHHPSYYLTLREAQQATTTHFHDELGYARDGTACVLPFGQHPQRGYAYHAWSCAVAAEDPGQGGLCEAVVSITGTESAGVFRSGVESKNEYCDLGA